MASINRRTYEGFQQETRRKYNLKIFWRGALTGFLAAALIFALCFLTLGPLVFGRGEETSTLETSSSEASSTEASSLETSSAQIGGEALSSEPVSEEKSKEADSVETSGEESSVPVSFVSLQIPANLGGKAALEAIIKPEKSSVATSKPASQTVSQAPSPNPVPSPLNTSSPAYLYAGEMQPESFLADSLFIGDSITQGMGLYLPDLNTTVLGVRSLNPDSVFTATVNGPGGKKMSIPKAAIAYNPKRIYIMIGTNGIAWMSQSYMIGRLGELVDQLHKALPKTKIILQSIPPVSRGKYNSDNRFSVKNIDAYNTKLLKLAEEKGVEFLDVNGFFRDKQGYLPSNETPDGIHFYKANYQKWVAHLLCHTVANRDKPVEVSSVSEPESSSQTETSEAVSILPEENKSSEETASAVAE